MRQDPDDVISTSHRHAAGWKNGFLPALRRGGGIFDRLAITLSETERRSEKKQRRDDGKAFRGSSRNFSSISRPRRRRVVLFERSSSRTLFALFDVSITKSERVIKSLNCPVSGKLFGQKQTQEGKFTIYTRMNNFKFQCFPFLVRKPSPQLLLANSFNIGFG